MGVCNCSMFCCTLLYVHFSIAIILMGKRERVALLNLSCWCLVMVERLFLAVPRVCLQFVIVVFPDHTSLLFLVGQHPQCYISSPKVIGLLVPDMEIFKGFLPYMSRDLCFQTMWHFDRCRLRRACAASF